MSIEEIDTSAKLIYFHINNNNNTEVEIGILTIKMSTTLLNWDMCCPDRCPYDARISLELLSADNQKTNFDYFNRNTGVIKIPANKAEYFVLNYKPVYMDFLTLRGACDIRIGQLVVEYNDPSSKYTGVLFSEEKINLF